MTKQTKIGVILAAAAVLSVSVASLVSARGWVQAGGNWQYLNNDNEPVTSTIQASGNSKFYLDENGYMVRDYFLENDDNDNTYYFGSNGAMVTNTWVAIDSSIVEDQQDYVPDVYWYYFGSSGKAVKGSANNPKKSTINGNKYMFNEYGQMLTGWIDPEGKTVDPDEEDNPFATAQYYAGGDNDGVLRSGWVTYYDGYSSDAEEDNWKTDLTNIYFYFNPSNNKKVGYDAANYETKTINNRKYVFSSEGIMMSGFDWYDQYGNAADEKAKYYSDADDGHLVKRGWVYAVPSKYIDSKKNNDDEEKYMYFENSGDIVKDQIKKINGKHYVFNQKGIMETGLVIWDANQSVDDGNGNGVSFVTTVDLDYATGEQITKAGIFRTGSNNTSDYKKISWDRTNLTNITNITTTASPSLVLHYFGDDGARKTGTNNIELSDDSWTFVSNGSGDKGNGAMSKKYYSFGFLLKANADIKYGLYTEAPTLALQKVDTSFANCLADNNANDGSLAGFVVLTTAGSKQKGNKTAKKDGDDQYWMIDKDTNYLTGIWTVNVKKDSGTFQVKELKASDFATVVGEVPATTNRANKIQLSTKQTIYDALGISSDGSKSDFIAGLATCAYIYANTTGKSGEYNASNTTYYIEFGDDVYWYQTDYDGKSNKWIPAGVKNDSNKTITVCGYTGKGTDVNAAYEVTPTNDMFLNCSWTEIKP